MNSQNRDDEMKKKPNVKNGAVIYCRVGNKGHASNLTTQERLCSEHCRRKGMKVKKVFGEREPGSGKNRPSLQRLVSFCRKYKDTTACVIVATANRIARDTHTFFKMRARLADCGIIIQPVDQLEAETASGKLFQAIFDAISEFERQIRSEGIRVGIRAKKKRDESTKKRRG